jgi:alpha-tubulin suppressor-like RCC1 family protein
MILAAVRASRSVRFSIAIVAGAATMLGFAPAASANEHVPYRMSAWGSNWSGQLGLGSELGPNQCSVYRIPCATSAVQLSGLSNLYAIAGGEEHSLSVQEGGAIRAWGSNESDQLGDGRSFEEQLEIDMPVGVCAPNNCASGMGGFSVAAGGQHSLALGGTGTAWAWGSNESGQLGDGFNGPAWDRVTPVMVKYGPERGNAPLSEVQQIAAGEEHSLALLSNAAGGLVEAWGNNEFGQLGDGKEDWHKDGPGEVILQRNPRVALTGVKAIAAGANHSIALLPGGGLLAWGSNDHGQLGDYINTGPETCAGGPCSQVAVWVAGPRKEPPVAIAAGGDHNVVLLKDGTVMAWGANGSGQLGDGTTEDKHELVPVQGLSNVVAIAAGEDHSLALLSNGTVMAWGANGEGQLGVGTADGPETCSPTAQPCSRTPVPVTGLSYMDVKGIAAGGWHSMAFGPPNPTVTAVSPNHGLSAGGTLVTITGTEFSRATAVKFGSANALTYKVESGTSITAVSPPGSGPVDVTVTTPEGTSPASPTDLFAYSPTGTAAPEPPAASASGSATTPAPSPAAPSGSFGASPTHSRIIGVNLGGFYAAPGNGWEKILQGSVRSLRLEEQAFATQAEQTGRGFTNMACVVGDGKTQPPVWREGKGHEPTLTEAMTKLGEGKQQSGVQVWEEDTLAEVKACATNAVAVIEIMNEPWGLHKTTESRATPADREEDAPLYAQMCLGLLRRVRNAGIHATVLASAAPNGQEWLYPVLAQGEKEGTPTLGELLGGLSFHPYGEALETAPQVEAMKQQYEYANQEINHETHQKRMANPVVYVTEYGVSIRHKEVLQQAEETRKMFKVLKKFAWVRGIWYYNFVDPPPQIHGAPHEGWYPYPRANGAKWKRERPVEKVVEACAREEAPGGLEEEQC